MLAAGPTRSPGERHCLGGGQGVVLGPPREHPPPGAFLLCGAAWRDQPGGAAHAYGIQQPAVSGQMRQLEEEVGAKLFERTPFRLTPAGERLMAHIQTFFENMDGLKAELRGGTEPAMRLGGAELDMLSGKSCCVTAPVTPPAAWPR